LSSGPVYGAAVGNVGNDYKLHSDNNDAGNKDTIGDAGNADTNASDGNDGNDLLNVKEVDEPRSNCTNTERHGCKDDRARSAEPAKQSNLWIIHARSYNYRLTYTDAQPQWMDILMMFIMIDTRVEAMAFTQGQPLITRGVPLFEWQSNVPIMDNGDGIFLSDDDCAISIFIELYLAEVIKESAMDIKQQAVGACRQALTAIMIETCMCKSTKQQLNTKSLTGPALVGVSDYSSNNIQIMHFLSSIQGHELDNNNLTQGNQSAIHFGTRVPPTLGTITLSPNQCLLHPRSEHVGD